VEVGVALGMKDAGGGGVWDLLAVEHLAEGGVVGDANVGGGNFEGEMEIADLPAQAGAMGGGGEGDFEDGLGLLGDLVGGPGIVEDHGVVAERGGEIEAEFASVFG